MITTRMILAFVMVVSSVLAFDGTVEIVDNANGNVIVSCNIHEYYESMSGFKAMKLRNRIKETLAGLSESCLYFAKKAN